MHTYWVLLTFIASVLHMPIIPALGWPRQEDYHEFEPILGSIVSSRLAWVTWWDPVSKKPTNQPISQQHIILTFIGALCQNGILELEGSLGKQVAFLTHVGLRQDSWVDGSAGFRTAWALQLVWESKICSQTAAAGNCQGTDWAAVCGSLVFKGKHSGFSNIHSFCFFFLAPT